jgi:hypothetical protein
MYLYDIIVNILQSVCIISVFKYKTFFKDYSTYFTRLSLNFHMFNCFLSTYLYLFYIFIINKQFTYEHKHTPYFLPLT